MTYNGYEISRTGNEWFPYQVYLGGKVQYSAVSRKQAKQWVDSYRLGVTWAVLEKLNQDKARAALNGEAQP
jgi:hypothetical protein